MYVTRTTKTTHVRSALFAIHFQRNQTQYHHKLTAISGSKMDASIANSISHYST
jgi:hypothetical protein